MLSRYCFAQACEEPESIELGLLNLRGDSTLLQSKVR